MRVSIRALFSQCNVDTYLLGMLISFWTLVIIYWSHEVEIGEDGVACTLFGNESLKEGTRGT